MDSFKGSGFMAKGASRVERRERKKMSSGVAHVHALPNNAMITITDAQGNTISWTSAGTMGFKGSRESTPYTAQMPAENATRKAAERGMRMLEVEVSGPGSGHESALRALQAAGFTVTSVADVKPLGNVAVRRMGPHKGARLAVPERPVSARSYEPDARARAILRGVAHAEKDLEAAGGTYDTDDVRALFRGVSRQAVDKKVAEGSLLTVPGPRGRRRFPAAQFTEDGSVVRGLKEVQSALGFSSQWSVLNFLLNDHDLLGNERPIDALRRGEIGRVVDAAKRSGVHGA